jgi:hypothetical protein
MALARSSTVIQFNDGCRYTVQANELNTIDRMSPCGPNPTPRSTKTVGWTQSACTERISPRRVTPPDETKAFSRSA